MVQYRIVDPHRKAESDGLALLDNADTVYLVTADPMEQKVDADLEVDYDGILCTGDMLYLAPPPGSDDIDGSLIAEYGEDAEDLYDVNNAPGILSTISEIAEQDAVIADAERRYRDFFDSLDAPLCYTAGNQDIPEALDAAASDYEDVQHVDNLDAFTGIDGVVPSFAGIPDGYFPVETDADTFYRQVTQLDEPVLVAHNLGAEDADTLGLDTVIASKPHVGERYVTEDTARLAPYPDYALLVTM